MDLRSPLNLLTVLWFGSEVALGLLRRGKGGPATLQDRSSIVILWIVIACSVCAGVALQFVDAWSFRGHPATFRAVAFVLMLGGIVIRSHAILTLGRFFTTRVAIHEEHQMVQHGLYRSLRHPAYTGLLLAFAGLGVSFGNGVSLAVVMVPITTAFLYRIRIEEASLTEAFGEQYREYCRTTKRLIPWVY
jgi:protein-S-isoprenylcysteine O-methyltransferase